MLYRNIVGSHIYITYTKPDLCFGVNYLSKFMKEPKKCHWVDVKYILRYILGNIDYGIQYKHKDNFFLQGYAKFMLDL